MDSSMAVPQKIKVVLSYDLTIPCLGIYSNGLKSGCQRDVWTPTPTLFEVLFTKAETWKQLKCSSTDEWDRVSHTHTHTHTHTQWSLIQH
jgi:hypothetical protein